MALAPRLELRQGQALVMTPQLQQAIKLLQLSNLELAEYVEQEMERNPLLEASADAPSEREAEREFEPAPSGEAALSLSEDGPPPSRDSDLDTDYENVYADESRSDAANDAAAAAPGQTGSDWQNLKTGSGREDGEFSLEATLTRAATLGEHLTEQLHIAIKDPRERMIGIYLIDQVDEACYITAPMTEIAERIGAEAAEVERVLKVLQTF